MGGLAAFTGDAVVDLSLWGEPSLHPDFAALVDAVLSRSELSLIVETSGLGWKPGLLQSISASHRDRIDWIVSLDAATPDTYSRLRGSGWEEALRTVELLLSLWPHATWPQMVRSVENEEGLEAFWRGWKKKTDNVIVQKYSTFAGLLPERKVADLSPLARRPCWHLMRDLSILIDGTVPLCREVARGEILLGGTFEGLGPEDPGDPARYAAALERIWKTGESFYAEHVEGKWPVPCGRCDEYYTYNA
jgi:spiro-SPASM protein